MQMIAGAIVFHAGVLVLLRTDSNTATLMTGWAIVLTGLVMMFVRERRMFPAEPENSN